MKLIYTLILLLFSSSVFAEFVFVDSSISDLLNYGFRIKQIDTIDMYTYVYHLKGDSDVAVCVVYSGSETSCTIDTQDKSLIELLNEIEVSPLIKLTGDDYLEQLSIEDVERDKELLAEEMDD